MKYSLHGALSFLCFVFCACFLFGSAHPVYAADLDLAQCNSYNDKYVDRLKECEANRMFAPAVQEAKAGCADGTWYNLSDRQCYSCPQGYDHYGAYDAHDENVCQKTDKHEGINSYTPSSIFESCKSGYYGQIKDGNNTCFTCPDGYSHNSSYTSDNENVCQKRSKHKGEKKYWSACVMRGQFDGLDGHCYSCPSGFKHDGLSAVSAPTICVAATVNPRKPLDPPKKTEGNWCFPIAIDFGGANLRYGYNVGKDHSKGLVSDQYILDSVDCSAWHHDRGSWKAKDGSTLDYSDKSDSRKNNCAMLSVLKSMDIPNHQKETIRAKDMAKAIWVGCPPPR